MFETRVKILRGTRLRTDIGLVAVLPSDKSEIMELMELGTIGFLAYLTPQLTGAGCDITKDVHLSYKQLKRAVSSLKSADFRGILLVNGELCSERELFAASRASLIEVRFESSV
jgi:hypothetical protein